MFLKDTAEQYGLVSRLNHWAGAALVIVLLAIGIGFHEMPRGAERMFWLRLHVGIGLLALLPLLWRIGWRMAVEGPAPLPQAPALQWVTRATHLSLLLLLGLLMATGPFIVWSAGAPLEAFGLFSLPSPLGEQSRLHEALETVHAVAGKLMLPLIGLHAAGALTHLLRRGNPAAARMA